MVFKVISLLMIYIYGDWVVVVVVVDVFVVFDVMGSGFGVVEGIVEVVGIVGLGVVFGVGVMVMGVVIMVCG